MASKPVRATKTRSPTERSCASRTSLDTASPSAISTSGASGEATRACAATIGWTGLADRDTVWALRSTSATRAKMLPNFRNRDPLSGIRCPESGIRDPGSGLELLAHLAVAERVLAVNGPLTSVCVTSRSARFCCNQLDLANVDASDPARRVADPGSTSVLKGRREPLDYGVRSARCNPIAINAPAITEME